MVGSLAPASLIGFRTSLLAPTPLQLSQRTTPEKMRSEQAKLMMVRTTGHSADRSGKECPTPIGI
jgi:hypothetical protein